MQDLTSWSFNDHENGEESAQNYTGGSCQWSQWYQLKTIEPLSHSHSGKYTENVSGDLSRDGWFWFIHTASDFPESVRALTQPVKIP